MTIATTDTTAGGGPRRERRIVWCAQFLCAMGQGMGALLLTWLVFEGDHGPAAIGLCIAAGVLPVGLGAAFASRMAERHPRRLILIGAQTLLAATVLSLAVATDPGLALLAAAALSCGLARVAFDAACLSVLHHLVAEERLAGAARDLTSHFHAGHLCGAGMVAGLVPVIGASALLAPCATIFACGAIVSACHRDEINAQPGRRPGLGDAVASGLRALIGERRLRPFALASVAAGLSAGGAGALVVPFLREDLRLGNEALAVLGCGVITLGCVMVAAPRVLGALPSRPVVAAALLAQPAALGWLAISHTGAQVAAGYCALAGAGTLLGIMVNHRRAHAVDQELRVPIGLAGGTLSAWAVAAGALVFGLAAAPLGEPGAYAALAVAAAGACALTAASARRSAPAA